MNGLQICREIGFHRSLLGRIMETQTAGNNNNTGLFTLNWQFRMSADICIWPNNQFYKTAMQNAASTVNYHFPYKGFCLFNKQEFIFFKKLTNILTKTASLSNSSFKIMVTSNKDIDKIVSNIR